MIVYRVTNTVTGKAYIGVTRHKAATRWKTHRAYTKRGSMFPLHHAMQKYGIENFRFEIICECSSLPELAACERGLIAEHGTYAPHGYNVTSGGEGCFERVVSDETRAKLSAAYQRRIAEGREMKPRAPGTYRHSDETKQKMRKKHRPMELSAAERQRRAETISGDQNIMRRDPSAVLRAAEKRRGRKRTPEQVERIRAGCRAAAEARARHNKS